MFTTRKRGRTAAVFGAVAGLLLTTATAASAVDPGPFSSPIIDPKETGSITITKLVDPEQVGEAAPGHEVTDLADRGNPVDNVTFEVAQVMNVDLTTHAGWQAVAALNGNVDEAIKLGLMTPKEGVTGSSGSGVVVFEDLPLGLYVVTETKAPDNTVPSSVPFLITVPMTNADATAENGLAEWLYDVYVYPKNETVSLEKSIVDASAAALGDTVTYTVSMEVPDGATSFIITDRLDPRLELDESSVKPIGLVDGVAHKITYNQGLLTAEFIAPEGGFLPAQKIGFEFEARVIDIGDGMISNTAEYTMTVNGVAVPGKSDPVLTKWGGITVIKKDATDSTTVLPLVEFQVYVDAYTDHDNDPGTPDQPNGILDGADRLLSVLQGDGTEKKTWITGGDGRVVIDGLRYSDFENNAPDATPTQYLLVETKTHGGYELLAGPMPFTVESPAETVTLTVENVPHNAGFPLPAIGGNRAVLPIVAAVIAAGGVVWLIRSRREQQV